MSSSLVINCGASHVAAAIFSESGGQLKLEELVTQELVYDYASDDAWLPALGEALREMSNANANISGKATFILPGYQLFTKPIKVPHVEKSKQTQIIAFEAQNNMPFPMNEVVWGSQIISDDGVETEVILIAQKAEQANKFCGLMKSIGLEPVSLQPGSLQDFNAYQLTHPGETEDTLLVNIGARSTNLTFVSPAGFFVRNINLGGNALTQMVADALGRPFGAAEQLKVSFYSGQTTYQADDPEVAPLQLKAQDFMKRLSQEITRSIVTYRRSSSRAAPARIMLTGRGSLLAGLAEFLSEGQKVSVDYLNPTTPLKFGGSVTSEVADQVYYQVSELVGEASRLVKKDAAGVNLLPSAIKERMQFQRQKPFLVLAAACLALAPLPIVFQYYMVQKNEVAQSLTVGKYSSELQDMETKIQEQVKLAEQTRARISQFEDLMNSRSNWIMFFADLQNMLSGVKDVWLDKLEVVREIPGESGLASGGGRRGGGRPPRNRQRAGAEASTALPVYKLSITGRMLLREYDPNGAINQTEVQKRVREFLDNLGKNPFVKSIESQNFDFSDKRLVGFDFVVVVNPEKPL